jgi:hypothetical protein
MHKNSMKVQGRFFVPPIRNSSPGRTTDMRSEILSLRNCEGKGLLGCLVFLVLFGIAIFLAIRLAPVYYSNYNFESDLKTEVSRAGARFLDNETIAKDIIDTAKKNKITLKSENIRIERFAGQIHIDVHYSVPVDLAVLKRNWNFEIQVSSFVGTL